MNPPSSPTIVGNAVETIVWSSEANTMASISPPKTGPIRAGGADADFGAVGTGSFVIRRG